MASYTLGLYEKSMPATLSFKDKLLYAKKAGFDYLEISIDETEEKLARLNMPTIERDALVDDMHSSGIFIHSMCLSGHRKFPLGSKDVATRNRGLEIMEKAIEFSAYVGVKIIQLAGYDVYYDQGDCETESLFIDGIKTAANMAAKHGVVLAFETMETNFMNTIEKSMRYVNLVNSPYLGVYPDCGNITNAALSEGKFAVDDLRVGKGHLFAIHLKETLPGKFREIPFGKGHVDFKAIINAGYDLGVRKYVAELWYVGNEDWYDQIVYANNSMRHMLDKAEENARAACTTKNPYHSKYTN